ncbi:hypothetical protein ABNQ39_24420 [Azospirillum sp. A26]|uniref:hypothetical protein n=1 Tax=Azospirillum sp. A26 TaxID=3160607 RepID=UPI003671B4DA
MLGKTTWAPLSVAALLVGCAGQQQGAATGDGTGATASAAPSTPGGRMVKSRDGRY